MTTWQDAATDTGTQSVKLRRMSMAHKDKTGSSRGRARGRSASKKSAENPRLKSATGKLQPGPRKPKPRGRPEVRLSTHKSRSVWFQARASWPLRDAPVHRLVEARVRSLHDPQAALAGQWENVGPSNIGGRTTCLVCHTANADMIWVGAAGGGVWQSADGGQTWSTQWHSQDILNIGALALDPSNLQTIYSGTGQADLSADSYPGVGLFRSSDGGATWHVLASADTRVIPRR